MSETTHKDAVNEETDGTPIDLSRNVNATLAQGLYNRQMCVCASEKG